MNFLYVAFENPAIYTLLNGMHDEDLWGLPAMYYPLKELLNRGHEVDILLVSDKTFEVKETNVFGEKNLHYVRMKSKRFINYEFPFRLMSETKKCLKKKHYDFVYGMGEGSYPAVAVAAHYGIPCALRQYGTQEMANVLEEITWPWHRWWTSIRNYTYITLSMLGKMTFLLATNDGSRADELYSLLGIQNKKFRFYFWRSGVSIPDRFVLPSETADDGYPSVYSPYHLSHIGRISDVKRQDRSARILGELHKRGYPFHLHLVGYPTGTAMLDATLKAAKEYGVEDYVHVEGNQPQTICRQFGRNSFVTLLVGEWNRVNIFYEMMGEGAVVLTNDNHSIDEFIEDGINCLVYEEDNFVQAAEKIIALMDDPEKINAIRVAAHQTAKNKFMSLEERFGMEVKLIENAAMGRDLSQFPEVL